MAKGRVKWFNNAKGYGFIRPDLGGDDLFVHYTYIEMEGYKTLRAGQPVEYEILEAPKGHHAIQVFAKEDPDFDAGYSQAAHEGTEVANHVTSSASRSSGIAYNVASHLENKVAEIF